jgi:hypothetical protein
MFSFLKYLLHLSSIRQLSCPALSFYGVCVRTGNIHHLETLRPIQVQLSYHHRMPLHAFFPHVLTVCYLRKESNANIKENEARMSLSNDAESIFAYF